MFQGFPVYAPDKLKDKGGIKIIISNTYMGTRAKIVATLKNMGFVENEDFTYIEIALSVFCWKIYKEIASQYVELSTTTYCTLNCKNCTAYMPYVRNKHHIPIEELIRGCDAYFRCVDYVGRFRILGGEPFVYPDLLDLITYLGRDYRDRIGELCIVSNGTVQLDEEMISVIKKYDVTLFISNYSKSGHPSTALEKYRNLLSRLDSEKIRYHFSDAAKWLALGNPTTDRMDSEIALREKYNDCRHYCRSIVDGHLFMCATWAFAVLGDIYEADWKEYIGDEILDLNAVGNMDAEEKFLRWHRFDVEMNIPNGYLDFCRYCNGFGSRNCNFVKVGEQK